MMLSRSWILSILFVLCVSGLVIAATEKEITKSSEGNSFPAGLQVFATVDGNIRNVNGDPCYVDFYAPTLSACAQSSTYNGYAGVKAWKGSYIDYTVRVVNNSDSVIPLDTPFLGLGRFSIAPVANVDDGPYSFNFSSMVVADNGSSIYDCTIDDGLLEKGQTAIGKCRVIIPDYIPIQANNYFFGDTVLHSSSFGDVRFSTEFAPPYHSTRLIFPQTSGTGFPDITAFTAITHAYDSPQGSNFVQTTYQFTTATYNTNDLDAVFSIKGMPAAPQGQSGVRDFPKTDTRCTIQKTGTRQFDFSCPTSNDSFNSYLHPQTILPSPWDYSQMLLFKETPVGSNSYEGATSLTGKNLVFSLGYYGQSRRWHPLPYVNNDMKDKAVEVAYVRANQGGIVYLDRTADLPFEVGFRAYRRDDSLNNGSTGSTSNFLDPSTAAFPKNGFNFNLYLYPNSADVIAYLAQNPTPFYTEVFDPNKTSAKDPNTKTFRYNFTVPFEQLNTLSAGDYKFVVVLSDATKTDLKQAIFSSITTPTSIIRIIQPEDNPFWDSQTRYMNVTEGVPLRVGLRNLFTQPTTMKVTTSGSIAQYVWLYLADSSGSCAANPPGGSMSNQLIVNLSARDLANPPAVNQWLCVYVYPHQNGFPYVDSNFSIDANLTLNGRSVTESLLVNAHSIAIKPYLFLGDQCLGGDSSHVWQQPLGWGMQDQPGTANDYNFVYWKNQFTGPLYFCGERAVSADGRLTLGPVSYTFELPAFSQNYLMTHLFLPIGQTSANYGFDLRDLHEISPSGVISNKAFNIFVYRNSDNRLMYRVGFSSSPDAPYLITNQSVNGNIVFKINKDSDLDGVPDTNCAPFLPAPENAATGIQFVIDRPTQNPPEFPFLDYHPINVCNLTPTPGLTTCLIWSSHYIACPTPSNVHPTSDQNHTVVGPTIDDCPTYYTPSNACSAYCEPGYHVEVVDGRNTCVVGTDPNPTLRCQITAPSIPQVVTSGESLDINVNYQNNSLSTPPLFSVTGLNTDSTCSTGTCTADPTNTANGRCTIACTFNQSTSAPLVLDALGTKVTESPTRVANCGNVPDVTINPTSVSPLAGDVVAISALTVRDVLFDNADDEKANVNGQFLLTYFKATNIGSTDYTLQLLDSTGHVLANTAVADTTCLSNPAATSIVTKNCSFTFTDIVPGASYRIKLVIAPLMDQSVTPNVRESSSSLANNQSYSNQFNVSQQTRLFVPDAPPWMALLVGLVAIALLINRQQR